MEKRRASAHARKEGEKEDKEEEPKRRYSFPLSPKRLVQVVAAPATDFFANQIEDIKEAQVDFLIDNVIAEVKREEDPIVKKKVKTVSRRT